MMNINEVTARDLPKNKFIELDSIKIRYWVAGEGEPIVFLHGGNSCIETWSFNFNELAQHYRVYAFDMVGAGLSDKPKASYSLDYQIGFLSRFVDTLGSRSLLLEQKN